VTGQQGYYISCGDNSILLLERSEIRTAMLTLEMCLFFTVIPAAAAKSAVGTVTYT
jgi:hypothetical protein